jgi:hypothetical protein
VVADRDGLRPLEVGVPGQRRLGLVLGELQDGSPEPLDRRHAFEARFADVDPERRCDLVVPRPARVDLPPDVSEPALDQRVDVLVARLVLELGQHLFCLRQLVGREEAGFREAARMDERRAAVVGEELRVVGLEELAHLRRELLADASGPERHALTSFCCRAAASSVSSAAIAMKPSAAACGKVSPVPYEASVSA